MLYLWLVVLSFQGTTVSLGSIERPLLTGGCNAAFQEAQRWHLVVRWDFCWRAKLQKKKNQFTLMNHDSSTVFLMWRACFRDCVRVHARPLYCSPALHFHWFSRWVAPHGQVFYSEVDEPHSLVNLPNGSWFINILFLLFSSQWSWKTVFLFFVLLSWPLWWFP